MDLLKNLLDEKDFSSFIKYANDLENENIEKSTILEFEGNFSEK
jgi:hypothetical protein